MIQKKHVTLEGLQQIINIKASMNLGLSDALKSAFPYTGWEPEGWVNRKTRSCFTAGFIEGEACFYVKITKKKGLQNWTVEWNFSQHLGGVPA